MSQAHTTRSGKSAFELRRRRQLQLVRLPRGVFENKEEKGGKIVIPHQHNAEQRHADRPARPVADGRELLQAVLSGPIFSAPLDDGSRERSTFHFCGTGTGLRERLERDICGHRCMTLAGAAKKTAALAGDRQMRCE